MTCCYCDYCMSNWWRHRDLCKRKFEFDKTRCSHPDNAMNNCQKSKCPTIEKECNRFKVITQPKTWDTKTVVRRGKTNNASETYYDEFPGKRKLSDVVNYLLSAEVGNDIDSINVGCKDD